MQVEQDNHYLMTKTEIENQIATLTGGRAAEEVVFGEISTGAFNDIERTTKLARSMVTRYGMRKPRQYSLRTEKNWMNSQDICIRRKQSQARSS